MDSSDPIEKVLWTTADILWTESREFLIQIAFENSMKVRFGELACVKVTGKKIVHTVHIILWVTLTLRNTLDMSNTCIRRMIESSSASGNFFAKM